MGHAQALRYLVASAVPGLMPENVTIIDSDTGRVLANDDAQSPAGDRNGLSETLRRNVERLLNARVGPGNAVVEAGSTRLSRISIMYSRLLVNCRRSKSRNEQDITGTAWSTWSV